MKLSGQIIIEPSKITEYLLVWKAENDKSGFLKMLGYSRSTWQELADEISAIVRENEAVYSRPAPYGGELYQVNGTLRGFGVVTIWVVKIEENTSRFVTLYPHQKRSQP